MRNRVVLACCLAIASACGTSPPPSTPGELLARDPTAAGESSRLAVPEPLIDISLIVRDLEGFYLFEDEQLEAANLIAAWAKTAHLTVEAPARTREILRRAANAQHALTGKACGGPLWSLAALERWREEIHADGRIETTVACLPDCVLIVKVSEGLDIAARDAGRTALWSAPFDPSRPWRDELALRLGQVEPQPIMPDAKPRADGARPRPAQVDAAFAPPDEESIPEALVVRARACLPDVGAIGLVLETDATGAITRCENFTHRIVANGPVAACACAAIANGTLIGGGPRRLATTILLPPGSSTVMTKKGQELDAYIERALKRDEGTKLFLPIVSDRSVREWEPPVPWIVAACFKELSPFAPEIRANVKITVDGTGRIGSSKIEVTNGTLTPSQSECVEAAIVRGTKVPCPDPGTHTMDAVLVVKPREP